MSIIETTLAQWEWSGARTMATLEACESLPMPREALGWRPGVERAHIAWQLMHIGVTEELFATERITGKDSEFSELIPRYKGGSTPDDDIPLAEDVRHLLETSRKNLVALVSTWSEDDLSTVPPALESRGWNLGTVLQVLTWHEAHHQGQAHITLNLWKAAHA